jgi:hypothetical protein
MMFLFCAGRLAFSPDLMIGMRRFDRLFFAEKKGSRPRFTGKSVISRTFVARFIRKPLDRSHPMENTLTLEGQIPFPSADQAARAHRALDHMLAATVCNNYSDCHIDVLVINVELATTKTAQDIAAEMARAGAISGVIVAKDPDAGIGDLAPTVAVIPIQNGKERLSMLNHVLSGLREDPAYSAALSGDAMEQIETFARSLVSTDPQQSAAKKETQNSSMRDGNAQTQHENAELEDAMSMAP